MIFFDRPCIGHNGLHTNFAHQDNICYGDGDRVAQCEQTFNALFTLEVCICININVTVKVYHCVNGDANANAENDHSLREGLPCY